MQGVVWVLVLVVNVVTAGLFVYDKWCARTAGRRRVRERTLLVWTFATGLVGAWLAMGLFRHKTRKRSFRTWALVWSLLNPIWLLVWWTTASQPG